MKAKVISAEKQTIPQFDAEVNADVLALMVVCEVEFSNDAGEVVHTQKYAIRPEQFDLANPSAVFDKQAAVMHNETEMAAQNAEASKSSALADDIISKLTAPEAPKAPTQEGATE
jgi:hypothetical protein